ncbi:MAG: hypothetical protein R3F60_14805 [bacterium]
MSEIKLYSPELRAADGRVKDWLEVADAFMLDDGRSLGAVLAGDAMTEYISSRPGRWEGEGGEAPFTGAGLASTSRPPA